MSATKLPAGFEALEPFVERWAKDTTEERLTVRAETSMEDIRAFYDVMCDHGDAAMAHIDTFKLDALPPDTARLGSLVLALAQAAVAIELHGAPRAPNTPWPNSIKLMQGVFPLG